MKKLLLIVFVPFFLFSCQQKKEKSKKLEIQTVIVSFFNPERQAALKAIKMNQKLPFPQGYLPLMISEDNHTLLITTGVGTARSASSLMALGMDERFDLSHAYFILTGISGGDPLDVSLGSVVFADYVVDADLKHSIDEREKPKKFKYGVIPYRRKTPFEQPRLLPFEENEYYRLNPSLVRKFFSLTKKLTLAPESQSLLKRKALYKSFKNAQKPPQILIGTNLDGQEYWHGKLKNDFANDWVKYQTGSKGNFMTSAMEDSGALQALKFLSNAKKVQFSRVLVLRSVSNFTMQGDNMTAYESFVGRKDSKGHSYSAFQDSLENLYIVTSKINQEIKQNWEKYA